MKALILALAAALAVGDDIPAEHDHLVVAVKTEHSMMLLDTTKGVKEYPGMPVRSVVALIMFEEPQSDGTVAIAGRIYIDCKERFYRIGVQHHLNKYGAEIRTEAAESLRPIRPGSEATTVEDYACREKLHESPPSGTVEI